MIIEEEKRAQSTLCPFLSAVTRLAVKSPYDYCITTHHNTPPHLHNSSKKWA
jgi:hypothetical protein